jgi:hypothetical protein
MKITEILNAKIIRSKISIDDYNRVSLQITLESGCVGTNLIFPIERIRDIFNLIDIDNYDKIKGSYIRMLSEQYKVTRIGNIIRDSWIDSF